jgi:hypothetical protein
MRNPFKRHISYLGDSWVREELIPEIASLGEILPRGVGLLVNKDVAVLLCGRSLWPIEDYRKALEG